MPLPASGNLRFLTRLLELVYSGVRRPRSMAQVLDEDVRRVTASLDTGEWLGVLTWDGDVQLTARGVRIAASPKRRLLWAAVVADHPFFVAHPDPTTDELVALATAEEPIPARARRHALALGRIARVALRAPPPPPRQLVMEFPARAAEARPGVDLRAGLDDNPDVYSVVLRALLDHGEVSPGQVRAMLDRCGGERCGIGGYLAMAVRRGDARRFGDVLVVTPGAIRRADVADSPVTVALSDPELRVQILTHLADGTPIAPRFRPWLTRLFGNATVATGLTRVLFDRPLASVPVAADPGPEIDPEPVAFLDGHERRGLAVAVPSSLRQLTTGLSGMNRALRAQATQASSAPTPVDRKLVVHGGLTRPGEQPPRAIPDGVSLRVRAVQNAPAFALLAALGLLDRRGRVRLRSHGHDVLIEAPSRRPGTGASMDLLVRTLAHARGWYYTQGLGWAEVGELADGIGLMTTVGDRLTLDEGFFHRLQTDPEHRGLYESLQPLAESLTTRLRAVE